MSSMTSCQQCGQSLGNDDRFCEGCGAQTTAGGGRTPTSSSGSTAGGSRAARVSRERHALLERVAAATQGRFEIAGELGRGGMAAVYLAHDLRLDRKVAIKVMLPGLAMNEEMVERFELEAKNAARLGHEHIVTIYSVEEAADVNFFVMQFIEGASLGEMIKVHGEVPVDVARHLLSQVAGALHFAHTQGVVHRDVKPGNVVVDARGNGIVTDFGISKGMGASDLTQAGSLVGTPAYMSPEQWRGLRAGPASDQYALGVMAYELLTGAPPFTGATMELRDRHVTAAPPDLAALRTDCSPDLVAAITRMLAKQPEERWPTLRDAQRAVAPGPAVDRDEIRDRTIALSNAAVAAKRPATVAATPVSQSGSGTSQSAPAANRSATVAATPVSQSGSGTSQPAPEAPPSPAAGVTTPATVIAEVVSPAAQGIAGREETRPVAPPGESGPVTAPVPARPVARQAPDRPATKAPARQVAATPPSRRGRRLAAAGLGGLAVVAIAAWAIAPGSGASAARGAPPAVAPLPASPPAVRPALHLTVADVALGAGDSSVAMAWSMGAGDSTPVAVRWRSSDSSVVAVDPGGSIVARGAGAAWVVGEDSASADSVSIQVHASVAALRIFPAPRRPLLVGEGIRLRVGRRDAVGEGSAVSDVEWHSEAPGVASVDARGQVTAGAPGTAIIVATVGSATADWRVEVVAPRLAAAQVTGARSPLRPRESLQLSVVGLDQRGRVLDLPGDARWSSSDPRVLSIDGRSGRVTARKPGRATITVAAGGHVAATAVEVSDAAGVPAPAAAGVAASLPPLDEAVLRSELRRCLEAVRRRDLRGLRALYADHAGARDLDNLAQLGTVFENGRGAFEVMNQDLSRPSRQAGGSATIDFRLRLRWTRPDGQPAEEWRDWRAEFVPVEGRWVLRGCILNAEAGLVR